MLLLEGLGAKDPGGERCGTAGRVKLINQVGSGSLLADIIIWHRLETLVVGVLKTFFLASLKVLHFFKIAL